MRKAGNFTESFTRNLLGKFTSFKAILRNIFHIICGKDADGDGEAGVDDDKHGAELEQEEIHQGWLRI